MDIQRDIFSTLIEEKTKKQITALVGARQVGKTTLMQEIYTKTNNSKFITFEDREILKEFEETIDIFIEKYIKGFDYIFIDEFQYAKKGGQKLKFVYDTISNIKIFISGSSHAELAIESLQYLVGRVSIIEIFPLTFKEFLHFRKEEDSIYLTKKRTINTLEKLQPLFKEYLQYGGYPQILLETDESRKETLLKNIVESYLFKEIRDILGYKNSYEFESILRRIALQDTKLLNKNSFSQDLGIEYKKVDEICNVLDKTYIAYLVRPFLKNKIKEQIKAPKMILQDIGFKNSLIKNFSSLEFRIDKGEIYENFVFNEIKRMGITPQFFNEQNRYEMDFVYEKNGKITGVECKSSYTKLEINLSIKRFIETFKPSKIIVFNESVDGEVEYKQCRVIFTHYLNIYQIEEL